MDFESAVQILDLGYGITVVTPDDKQHEIDSALSSIMNMIEEYKHYDVKKIIPIPDFTNRKGKYRIILEFREIDDSDE